MNMKKKWIAITALSALLVGGSALTISANNDGYYLYKTAMKNTHTLASATASIESTVKINGEIMQAIEMDGKYNLNQKTAQGTMKLSMNEQTEQIDVVLQDSQFYIKNHALDQTFAVKSKTVRKNPHHDPDLMKIGEKIFDTVTVPLHDNFKVDNNKITVDLTNNDIPALFREIGQYMVKKGTAAHENATMSTSEYPFLSTDISANLPVLTENIKIDSAKLMVELTNDNFIDKQTMYMKVSGEDKDGKRHVIEMNTKMDFDNMNKTTLENVIIDENVQTIELKNAHY